MLLAPLAGRVARAGMDVHVDCTSALVDPDRVLVYMH